MSDGTRSRVLLACGYFDWFSGYQEVGLAKALAELADTHVLAGNRVNPLFSDEHLERIGQDRTYTPGTVVENGVTVTRLASRERRSMLWSPLARDVVAEGGYDLVIQVMPGQGLPAAASLAGPGVQRSVLYGDNIAMYASLGSLPSRLKYLVFGVTKGSLYRFVNRRAAHVYGYTPNTLERLAPFSAGREMQLLPLTFDSAVFAHDVSLRRQWRHEHGYGEDDVVVLAAGKIQAQKRIDSLVRAVAQLEGRHPGLRLHVIGADRSDATERVLSTVEDVMGNDRVVTEGFVDAPTLNRAFNGADVGVWPAMPAITIQQAMGTGLPVLLPDNDLVSHLVDRPGSGSTFTPTEPLEDALAAALTRVVDNQPADSAERHRLRRERAGANTWLSTPAVALRLLTDARIGSDPS